MIEKFFKFYILRNTYQEWYLFGIDLLRKKCYSIKTKENNSSEKIIQDLRRARSYWSNLLKQGYEVTTLKNELDVPSLLTQRLKEWNSFCFNQYNGWKNKKRITDPWSNDLYEIDQEDNNNVNEEVNYSLNNKSNSIKGINEFDDFDNFWNQEGVFEELSDLDGTVFYHNDDSINPINESTYTDIDEKSNFENSIRKEAINLYLEGDFPNSIKKIDQVLKINKFCSESWFYRGASNQRLHRYEEAIADFDKALENNATNSAEIFNKKGLVKVCIDNFEGAITDFNKALIIDKDFLINYEFKGLANLNLGRYEEALIDLDTAIVNKPDNSIAYGYRGIVNINIRRYQNAIDDFSKALEISPQDKIYLNNRGDAKYRIGDYEGAIDDFSMAIKQDSEYVFAIYNKGLAKQKLNDHKSAIDEFSKGLEKDPVSINMLNNRGISKMALKDFEGAIKDYSKILEIDPNFFLAFNNRGLAKQKLNDHKSAIDDFSKGLEIIPEDVNLLNNRGLAKQKLNDHKSAIDDFSKGLEIIPEDVNLLNNRGVSKYYLKDYLGSIEDYSRILEIDPKCFMAHKNKGISKYYLGDYKGAIDDFSKALKLQPSDIDALELRGRSKQYLRDCEGALQDYSKGLEINPDNIYLLYNRGILLEFQKKVSLAMIDFEKVYKINPDFENISEKIDKKIFNAKKIDSPSNDLRKNVISQNSINSIDSLLIELDSFIGLAKVKNEIKSLINFQQIQIERNRYGYINDPINNHMVFYGSPGTGKTEIARLVGKILKSLGILSKGHFIEADRSSLIGGYIGQTAIKTNEVLQSALGGVLFIDEAYSLNTSSISGDFGEECISTVLKFMEDNRNDFVLIVAGYENEMESFLAANPGFRSRFNTKLLFCDFSEKELLEILLKIANDKGYKIQEKSKTLLKNNLAKISEFKKPTFGNARSMRNLLEIAIKNQAIRLMKKKERTRTDLEELILEDFEITSKQLEDI